MFKYVTWFPCLPGRNGNPDCRPSCLVTLKCLCNKCYGWIRCKTIQYHCKVIDVEWNKTIQYHCKVIDVEWNKTIQYQCKVIVVEWNKTIQYQCKVIVVEWNFMFGNTLLICPLYECNTFKILLRTFSCINLAFKF